MREGNTLFLKGVPQPVGKGSLPEDGRFRPVAR